VVSGRSRGRCRHRRPARPGRGPHQRRDHRVAERAARAVAGRDHPRDHRPVRFLRQGGTRRPARGRARRRPVPPGRSSQRHAHPGPPTSHPRDPRSTRPQNRPSLGGTSPAADRYERSRASGSQRRPGSAGSRRGGAGCRGVASMSTRTDHATAISSPRHDSSATARTEYAAATPALSS